MKRFLVVGCGGSGGATLAYLMDQLRSDLAAVRSKGAPTGIHSLPRGWQFVQLDVPMSPDAVRGGPPDVVAQGGSYVATGSQTGNYGTIDHAVSQRLAAGGALGSIATWAPRNPADVSTPPSIGAGQYRAVGRMITLNSATEVVGGLRRAWEELSHGNTLSEMNRLQDLAPALGAFSASDAPVVLVVSSMAGGAGASMALDVCRLLPLVQGSSTGLTAVFMVGADVFEGLETAGMQGVRPNALAMLGEIVATQAGAARRHDAELLAALGHRTGEGVKRPFNRVFPVSRFIGAERTVIGDGSPQAVYRALGRGLGALMMSGVATDQFAEYDLGNTGSPEGDRGRLGWGADWDPLPWGAFGYAGLSMGRDRYAEYAAQRLARSCVDRLLEGHLQPGSTASGEEQRKVLVESQWLGVLRALRLPVPTGTARDAEAALTQWFVTEALPREHVMSTVRTITEADLVPFVPAADGQQGVQWLSALRTQLARHRVSLTEGGNAAAYRWAFDWQHALLERTSAVVEDAVATHGLAYARGVVERLRNYLEDTVGPGMQALGQAASPDVGAVPATLEQAVGRIRGVVVAGQELVTSLVDGVRVALTQQVLRRSTALAAEVLRGYVTDVLGPLDAALAEAQKLLEIERGNVDTELGLARLATDHYPGWPSDNEPRVALRFSHADNEVLITSSQVFPEQYQADLLAAVAEAGSAPGRFDEARTSAGRQVVSGRWTTTGGEDAPGGLLEQTATWRPRAFLTDPRTGTPMVPSVARFDLHVRPAELLARARAFIARPDESFARFTAVSLRAYVEAKYDGDAERVARAGEIVRKFQDALLLARPLAKVNPDAVKTLYGEAMEYRYKFSAVPFNGLEDVASELKAVLARGKDISQQSAERLGEAMESADDSVTRIDIFGSYMNYLPLVFDSVLRPVSEQWGQTLPQGRGTFWRWRRSRPLDAALPMADVERETMVVGWFLAQILGDLRIPPAPYTQPVTIWDAESAEWLAFPHPMLTPPDVFLCRQDWLPAVLESILLAYARCHEEPVMASLRPYRALRATYDAGLFDPSGTQAVLAGSQRLTAWLRAGTSPSGGVSRIPDVADARTPEERADRARLWLRRPLDVASVTFMAPGQDGAPGGGEFSTIVSRRQAGATPIYRDLAPDVRRACGRISAMLDEALAVIAGRGDGPDDMDF